jgi:hypothetical protein
LGDPEPTFAIEIRFGLFSLLLRYRSILSVFVILAHDTTKDFSAKM